MKKRIPFSFVLEVLDPLEPIIKPMFGCHSIYLGEKIVLFLCELEKKPYQKGVWVATTPGDYLNLAQEFSSTRAIENPRIGKSPWLLLPAEAEDFEEQVLKACELILNGDPRIGRVPRQKRLQPANRGPGSQGPANRGPANRGPLKSGTTRKQPAEKLTKQAVKGRRRQS